MDDKLKLTIGELLETPVDYVKATTSGSDTDIHNKEQQKVIEAFSAIFVYSEIEKDLKLALENGWFGVEAYEDRNFCVYCEKDAPHNFEKITCDHTPGCLMTKYAYMFMDI